MTTDKLMKICKVSKLNRTQLDEMRRYNKNQKHIFKITRNGPFHVDVKKALETAQLNGFFRAEMQ